MAEILKTTEFAKRAGVCPETVRRRVQEGSLEPYGRTPGGHFRFSTDQVKDFLSQGSRDLTRGAGDIRDHVNAARALAKGWDPR